MNFNRNAFTLIELLVAVLIIGILATIALPQYQTAVLKSKLSSYRSLLKSLADSQEIHKLTTGSYTKNFGDLLIAVPGDCSEPSCILNDKDVLVNNTLNTGDIAIYADSTSANTNKLTLTIIIDTDKFTQNVSNFPVSKGQVVCYDRGNARFSKGCQSLSPTNSFNWGNGKGWVI
jgi:prepilin-type N-terminal cleavage/methylation domain-containing protein